MQRFFLFSEIIYKNMLTGCWSRRRRKSVKNQLPTTGSPTPNPSTSGFVVSGHGITPSTTTDSKLKTRKSDTKTEASASSLRKRLIPTRTSVSQTTNKSSDSHSTASIKSSEKKVNNSNKDSSAVIPSKEKTEIDRCAICLDDYTEPKQLDKCSHKFCTDCIDHYFQAVKPQCPCCFTIYGEIRGNQPENGTMTYTTLNTRLPGFGRNSSGTIKITYHFPSGIQDENHPNPGAPYYGTTREAYLPDNPEGRHVLKLLERAFNLRQIFTVGQSRTTGRDNVVTWNDIHHKTSTHGGMENFGYPDKTYLNRVQQELSAKGIK